jgi:alkylation response protein AidB-like acyl-CoA dehydrogenase
MTTRTTPTSSDEHRLAIDATSSDADVTNAVRTWVETHVPETWRTAAARGGAAAVRQVRTRPEYEAWYPAFAASGMVAPVLPVAYGGLGIEPRVARLIDAELRSLNLGKLNIVGVTAVLPVLLNYGTEEQRRRFIAPLVRNEEIWCQLFSEPGAGSDLASLACRAERDGDEWVVTGQKVWNTWAHYSQFGLLVARTDPDVPKRQGLTVFACPIEAPGVTVRPLIHITGEIDFNEVFLDQVRIPDEWRLGPVGAGWKVVNAALGGERTMVSGSGAGGVERIGGSGVPHLIRLARENGRWADSTVRQTLMSLYCEERVRQWTNARVRDNARAGRAAGPESSIGKVHQGEMNQRIQMAAAELLGPGATAWTGAEMPFEVHGMLRSRANTIEGGTSEVNRNILGERVLGLPREPDPYQTAPWKDVPRS